MHEPNISPLARRLAEENNVYWQHLMGTGPEGKVVEKDVIEYLHRVMAGDEAINSTPEPLPVGVSQWPQENLANLVVPGQEQYGGEMHTSWQNEAITDLEDLEESRPQDAIAQESDPGINLVESQADSTSTYINQSRENQVASMSRRDDLDNSLLLNESSNSLEQVSEDVLLDDSKAIESEVIDSNAFEQPLVDSYESDFTEFDTGLADGLDSGFDKSFDTAEVDALLDQPVNTTGFATVDDGLDYLDDDFGFDFEGDLDPNLDAALDTDSRATKLTTESVDSIQPVTSQANNTDTIETLFYDETALNESAFDAELDDLLFDDPGTGFEEPKATAVDNLNNDNGVLSQDSIDQSVAQPVEQLSLNEDTLTDDLRVTGDTFSGFDDAADFSFDSGLSASDKEIALDDSEFSLFEEVTTDDIGDTEFSGLEPKANSLENISDTIGQDAVIENNVTNAVSNEASQSLNQEADVVDNFDDLLDDVSNSDTNTLSTIDDDLFAGADLNSLETLDTDLDIDADTPPSLADNDFSEDLSLDEFGAGEQREVTDKFDDLSDTTFSADESFQAKDTSIQLNEDDKATLSDFDIADTDFGSAEERLDDQSFATRDEIATSFGSDDDVFAALDTVSTGQNDSIASQATNSANIAEDLLATSSEELELGKSPEDKALEDAFLDSDSILEDAPDVSEYELFADDSQKLQAASTVEEVENLDFLDDIDLDKSDVEDISLASSLEESALEDSLSVDIDSADNKSVQAVDETLEMDLDDFDLDSVDLDDDVLLEANAATGTSTDSDSFLSEFDLDGLDSDMATENQALNSEQGSVPEGLGLDSQRLEHELDADLDLDSVVDVDADERDLGLNSAISEDSINIQDDKLKVDADIDNDIDRRFEEALDTAAEQADPYAQPQRAFNDDIFSDSEGLSFSDESFDTDVSNESVDTKLTWSDVDLDAEDPLVELERELASELSGNQDFLNNDSFNLDHTNDNNQNKNVALGATAAGAALGALGAANSANNNDDKVGPNGENWAFLEEILEDDAEDILAEQAGDVEHDGNLFVSSNDSLELDSMEDFDLEASLNELESELLSDEKSEEPSILNESLGFHSSDSSANALEDESVNLELNDFEAVDLKSSEFESGELESTEFESGEFESSESASSNIESSSLDESATVTQNNLQDEILNQMVDDSSVIDDVTAIALLEEANLNSDTEAVARQSDLDLNIDSVAVSGSEQALQSPPMLNLQNYQVARRYVELTKLLAANTSIAQELQSIDSNSEAESQELEAITPLVLLTRAAAKAMQQFPLGSQANELLVSKFSKAGSTYLSLDNVLDRSVADLVKLLTTDESKHLWITNETANYEQKLSNSGVVVADLSAFQLDELVTSQQKPVLALGRIVHENDSYVSTLSLSGDVDLESASAFLARVAYLLSDPIRLLV